MDPTYFSASAQPFQPAMAKRNSMVGANAGPMHGGARFGGPGGFIPPHVLSQIQNQMSNGVPPRQAGLVPMPMNAQTKPFVSVMQQPRPPAPQSPFHNASISPVLSRPVPPRLGHAMNPGSVQLTGLQTFLGNPGAPNLSMGRHAPSASISGPISPMTPNAHPANPFMFPPGPAALGPVRPMKNRKGKGPIPNVPLKISGHNSTPSISLNPAAFAASLTAGKAKKKIIVTIPKEGSLPDDEQLLSHDQQGSEQTSQDELEEGEAEEIRLERFKTASAKEGARTRSMWIRRDPTQDIDWHTWGDKPQEMISCQVYPESWPTSIGLPETIDIYLPGQSSWETYREIRLEQKLAAAEALQHQPPYHTNPENWINSLHDSVPYNESGMPNSKSMSISSPADSNMVSFKLNRYLESQQLASQDPNLTIADNNQEEGEQQQQVGHVSPKSFGRFQSDLPPRLKEAFAKRQADKAEKKSKNPTGHGYTMSLGLPSSGGPFASAALSALEMIRANSDLGPMEPSLGERPETDRTSLSDGNVGDRRQTHTGLTDTLETPAETEADQDDTDKPSGWKDLARGFGYEIDDDGKKAEAGVNAAMAETEAVRKHGRQASRISVSTSRRGQDEMGEEEVGEDNVDDDGADEIRTNPSEDADASDFEEEIDTDAARHADRRRWSHRGSTHLSEFGGKRQAGSYYDDASDMSDDDLRDSLTPSDEQFSNPSDEEAAREERMLRRQHRAALRSARHESRRRRIPAGTDNTLPSSSIGEAESDEHIMRNRPAWSLPRPPPANAGHVDIISNPSDEAVSDIDGQGTFGDPPGRSSGDRLSQDFRFPRPQAYKSEPKQSELHNPSPFQFGPPVPGALGRAVGASMLNPVAKEFNFGASSDNQYNGSANQHIDGNDPLSEPQPPHFRLPSIHNSSFGSSALGDVGTQSHHQSNSASGTSRPAGLNAAAPSFTPGSFTFTAPGAARFEIPSSSGHSQPASGSSDDNIDPERRDSQGREKRQKFGPLDAGANGEQYEYSSSPPRPGVSTASIEGPLRDFSTLTRRGPPPFNLNGASAQIPASGSRFKIEAPVFTPTWSRSSTGPGGTAKRPGLPDFNLNHLDADQTINDSSATPSFAFNASRKAIPIQKPDQVGHQGDENEALEDRTDRGPDVPRNESDLAEHLDREAALGLEKENAGFGQYVMPRNPADTRRQPLAPIWDRSNQVTDIPYGKSPPINIPHSTLSNMNMSVETLTGTNENQPKSVKQRIAHMHSLSRESIGMSIDGRLQRQSQPPNSFDTDDESLTDFIEELAERVDKALEGWAGKILDEVTIMGQVRPIHRPGTDAHQQQQMVETISNRIETLMDLFVSRVETVTVNRKLTLEEASPGDETQATIKAPTSHSPSSSSLDAPGEIDLAYVQEMFDLKMQTFQNEFKQTFSEALAKHAPLDTRSAGIFVDKESSNNNETVPNLVDQFTERILSAGFADQMTSLVMSRLTLQLEGQLNGQLAGSQRIVSETLETTMGDHFNRLHEKTAADRLDVAQIITEKLERSMQDWKQELQDVRSHINDQIQMGVVNRVIPQIETLRTDPLDADVIAARVTEILVPMISNEREQRQSETAEMGEQLKIAASLSVGNVAEETANRLRPIVEGLRSDPIDSDALVQRLSEVIGKQSIEHMVDLSPVMALLEPLISKQEDIRDFARKMVERQKEVERTMSELPDAINVKTEMFLSTTSETRNTQASILTQVEKLHELQERFLSNNAAASQNDQLSSQLKDKDLQVSQLRAELEEVRTKLPGANEEHATLRAEFAKLEGRLEQAEKDRAEAEQQLKLFKEREEQIVQNVKEAEQKVVQAETLAKETRTAKGNAENEAALLKSHIEQLTIELNEARAERAREREAAAQATAEALARAERVERQTKDIEKRSDERVEKAERKAQEDTNASMERAAKAEGQVLSLEKRVAEQDTKIGNLQTLAATQKQNTATSQQKLAEAEKKTKEFEMQAQQLAVANARLLELEERVKDTDELRDRLRIAQDAELRLRDDVSQYHARFSEMEKDLITMKEGLVGRSELETCQVQLAASREEVASLRGQLVEKELALRESKHLLVSSNGWVEVSRDKSLTNNASGSSGLWGSMHAPPPPPPTKKASTTTIIAAAASNQYSYGLGQDTGSADTSADTNDLDSEYHHAASRYAQRSFSITSSNVAIKEVVQDDGGWWS